VGWPSSRVWKPCDRKLLRPVTQIIKLETQYMEKPQKSNPQQIKCWRIIPINKINYTKISQIKIEIKIIRVKIKIKNKLEDKNNFFYRMLNWKQK
jgi:hypothetical protein